MIQDMERDQQRPVIAAINSNFFVMPEGGILGIAIDEHKAWSLDLASLLKPSSGVLGIESGQPFLESKDVLIGRWGPTLDPKDAARWSFAVQGYPRLIQDGNLAVTDEVLNARHPRTSIGIESNSGRVLLVTIDASAEGESGTIGMTLFEYAHLLKSTSCGITQNMALNLDGGGSSAFAIPSLGLYEQADHCRHLGNILTIRAR
jgi:exopolysaccharide biosynthesis protein